MRFALGVDFGTSTTVIAAAEEGEVSVLADESGAVFPSVIAFPPDGRELIGRIAKVRREIDSRNTVHSFKRIIGRPWDSSVVRTFMEKYPFRIEQQGLLPHFSTRAGSFSAVDLCSKLMSKVHTLAKAKGTLPATLIATIPVEYDERQRAATIEAARAAGFDRVHCVDEPLAIARAFLRHDIGKSRRIAIYDLGGGTFDFAVCQVQDRRLEVLATGGDAYLGGDDIDLSLAEWVANDALSNFRWDVRSTPQRLARLLDHCERAKIQLSTSSEAVIDLGEFESNDILKGKQIKITSATLQKVCVDLVRRSFAICDEVLASVNLRAREIDEVFLAGGSSSLPIIGQLVTHYFGKPPTRSQAPDHLVAIGGALIARNLNSLPASRIVARRSPRLSTDLHVDVSNADSRLLQRTKVINISSGGMLIFMASPPPAGSQLILRFGVDEELILSGTVVRVGAPDPKVPDRGQPLGIQFGMMSDVQKGQLAKVIAHVAAQNAPAKADDRAITIDEE